VTSTYGYNNDTGLCCLYNRDDKNAVGFETRKLDMYEGNQLAHFMDRLYNEGFRRGQQELAEKIRRALPQEAPK
jgi:hypothetical protein